MIGVRTTFRCDFKGCEEFEIVGAADEYHYHPGGGSPTHHLPGRWWWIPNIGLVCPKHNVDIDGEPARPVKP